MAKPHSNMGKIQAIAAQSLANEGQEMIVSGVNNRSGEPIPITTVSMYLANLRKECPVGFTLYCRTCKETGAIYIGAHRKMDFAQQIESARATHKAVVEAMAVDQKPAPQMPINEQPPAYSEEDASRY